MDDERWRVLLVDDDEDDYVLTRDLLGEIEGTGVDLQWEPDYDAALSTAAKSEHDVYLFDYRLGGRTGLELLCEATAKGCRGPIILLTGQGDRSVDVEAMKAGAADYLVKGKIDAALLERSIRYAIGHRRSADQILHMAYYDHLTGLPNRVLFQERLLQGLGLAERYDRAAAVLFLDLDNFKRINDTLGHRFGDLLLRVASQRLNETVRASDALTRRGGEKDTVARLGGDEFTIFLSEVATPEDAARVARRCLDVLSRPYQLEGHEVTVTASIGIAAFPGDGGDIDALLKNADTAMYCAKETGKNTYQFYQSSMNASAMEKLTLEADLRKAVEREELLVHYQPQVKITSGRTIGLEALLRWQCPTRGMVSPATFIPVAEENVQLIGEIGAWVLRAACRQARAWEDLGLPRLPISVNVSSQQFRQEGLPTRIASLLQEFRLDPGHLVLEITESVLLEDRPASMEQLRELTGLGLRLSMDDFGTGYSSLSYLKRFPLHALKVDRSFIRDLTTNPDDAAITRAIIAMAHSLNLQVVAEGVETAEQRDFLLREGCEYAQGFLFSRPRPADEIAQLLRAEAD
ncbi:MAG: EAL domain-containing protein [Deltaproteobacteria bacterium]|nr:EAL domain-containing protein [Deltaproteobacteria bacterium]